MRLADLHLEQDGQVVCASLTGDVDLSNAGSLRAELTGATSNHALGLIVDLTDVDYLDSAGLHLLHHLREDVVSRGQRFRLVIPSGSIAYATMRLAGLDWHAEIVETVGDARQAILGS